MTPCGHTSVVLFSKWKLWACNELDNDHWGNNLLRGLYTWCFFFFFLHFVCFKLKFQLTSFCFDRSCVIYTFIFMIFWWSLYLRGVFIYILRYAKSLMRSISEILSPQNLPVSHKAIKYALVCVSCPSGCPRSLWVKCWLCSRSKSVIFKED